MCWMNTPWYGHDHTQSGSAEATRGDADTEAVSKMWAQSNFYIIWDWLLHLLPLAFHCYESVLWLSIIIIIIVIVIGCYHELQKRTHWDQKLSIVSPETNQPIGSTLNGYSCQWKQRNSYSSAASLAILSKSMAASGSSVASVSSNATKSAASILITKHTTAVYNEVSNARGRHNLLRA